MVDESLEVADREIQQSETGQQLLYRLNFLLLTLGDGFRQLDGGRVLTLSDLGLCQGDGALMVPDHALEKQPLTAGAVGPLQPPHLLCSYRAVVAVMLTALGNLLAASGTLKLASRTRGRARGVAPDSLGMPAASLPREQPIRAIVRATTTATTLVRISLRSIDNARSTR